MPAIMASTISPKWSTKRPAVCTPAGTRDDHGLVVERVERMNDMLRVLQAGLGWTSDGKRIEAPRLADFRSPFIRVVRSPVQQKAERAWRAQPTPPDMQFRESWSGTHGHVARGSLAVSRKSHIRGADKSLAPGTYNSRAIRACSRVPGLQLQPPPPTGGRGRRRAGPRAP